MNTTRSSQQVLDDELLPLRAKLLEVAAGLDRVERGEKPAATDETLKIIRAAIETLLRPGANRAEQIQLLFSRPYDEAWRKQMNV